MSMTIGQAASHAGVNVQTIRYYERRGLISEPERTPSGYRRYADDVVRRVGFIKRAQELGFSLNEISDLLKLRVRSATVCAAVEKRARSKIAVVEEKIADLQRMKRVLRQLVAACETREPTGDCPILETLES
jgi:MerR family mercuric resistance operon transcriptional regulator